MTDWMFDYQTVTTLHGSDSVRLSNSVDVAETIYISIYISCNIINENSIIAVT